MIEKCTDCGRFIPYKDMENTGKASVSFIPDTAFSKEEISWKCKKCTEDIKKRLGIILPTEPEIS